MKTLSMLLMMMLLSTAVIAEDKIKVFMIGDSICGGYKKKAESILGQNYEVSKQEKNGKSTWNGLKNLDTWLGDKKFHIIQFNFGLHDLKQKKGSENAATSLEQYIKNLKQIIARLKKTNAVLVWVSTTPVPPINKPGNRDPKKVKQYNAAAAKLMQAEGIMITDLHAAVSPHMAEDIWEKPQDVHFNDKGKALQAKAIATGIKEATKKIAKK